MSHKKLRSEAVCLNCGHTVEERFCPRCGQENLELNDSALHLIIHYFQDLFHYDGKLWQTLKSLLLRPGLVPKAFMEGKRQSHLEPIRFYVFSSTVFFLIFFLVLGSNVFKSDLTPESDYSKRLFLLEKEKEYRKGEPDTAMVNQLITSLRRHSQDSIQNTPDSILSSEKTIPASADSIAIAADSTDHIGESQPDSVSAPSDYEMGWLEKIVQDKLDAKNEELKSQYDGDYVKAMNALLKEILYKLPQLFFLSLPFFALFLKLLYWRSRKSAYVEHFIFAVYHFAYIFSIMIVYFIIRWVLGTIEGTFSESLLEWLALGIVIYPFIYLFLSMKRFYDDIWGRLIIRYIFLMILLLITIIALFLVLAVLTFLFKSGINLYSFA